MELEKLTQHNYNEVKLSGGGYCLYCFHCNNPYKWKLDIIRRIIEKDGDTAICSNCLETSIIPKNYFTDKTKKERKEELSKLAKKIY